MTFEQIYKKAYEHVSGYFSSIRFLYLIRGFFWNMFLELKELGIDITDEIDIKQASRKKYEYAIKKKIIGSTESNLNFESKSVKKSKYVKKTKKTKNVKSTKKTKFKRSI
jgi:hypothetical protein